MKDVFERMAHDPDVMARMKTSPIREALFFALHDFVVNGGDLSDVPWFAVTKLARRHKRMT